MLSLTAWALAAVWLQPSPEPPQPALMSGRVVSATTGEPLARARVSLRQAGGSQVAFLATADAQGDFQFEGVPPGSYLLAAEKPGYLRQNLAARASAAGSSVSVAAGRQVTGLLLKLTPQAILNGRILDEEGEPIAYAGVSVLRKGYVEGVRRLVPVREAQANELGEFRVAELGPGRYYLLASGGGRQRAAALRLPGARPQAYAPAFYPDAPEETTAAPIELEAGRQLDGLEIRLRRTPLYRVSGRLVLAGLPEAQGAYRIALVPRAPGLPAGLFGGAALSKRETFEIPGVLPGSYILTVMGGDRAGAVLARQPIEVARGDLEGLVIQLAPPAEVRGAVRLEGPLKADLRSLRLSLIPAEGPLLALPRSSPQADGAFRFAGVARGSYRLQVSGLPEGAYLKAARLSGQDALGRAIELAGPGAMLEVVLAAGAGQIEGVVLKDSGDPEPLCTVALAPDPPQPYRSDLYKRAECDAEGRFRLSGIAPGVYKLWAFDELEPGAERDPDLLRLYESQAARIAIESGGSEQVRLKRVAAAR